MTRNAGAMIRSSSASVAVRVSSVWIWTGERPAGRGKRPADHEDFRLLCEMPGLACRYLPSPEYDDLFSRALHEERNH